MKTAAALLIPLLILAGTVRLMSIPMKAIFKIFVNSAGGLICLWMLNSIHWVTGMAVPINPVTVVIAGFLGLPGIGLLYLAQALL